MIPPFLFSYHYLKKSGPNDLAALCSLFMKTKGASLMIDSGAFSAHRIGARIRLTNYIESCKYYQSSPNTWGCVQLDVIGNAEQTYRNLYAMVDKGVTPMPVLTVDAPYESLLEFQQINKRICIAGALGSFTGRTEYIETRYRQSKSLVPNAQLHGLGYIRYPSMYSVGLSSCDSSSHATGMMFGNYGRFSRSEGIDYIAQEEKTPGAISLKWKQFIRDCGLTLAEINDRQLFTSGSCSFTAIAQSVCCGMQAVHSAKHGLQVFSSAPNWCCAARMLIGLRFALPDGRFDYHKAREEYRKCQVTPKYRMNRLAETLEALNEK